MCVFDVYIFGSGSAPPGSAPPGLLAKVLAKRHAAHGGAPSYAIKFCLGIYVSFGLEIATCLSTESD